MAMQKIEFEFPEPGTTTDVAVSPAENTLEVNPKPPKAEPAPAPAAAESVEIEVVDDTPPKDRGRKPSPPPSEVTEDELEEYSDKVKKRIQHFSKGYHDERRKAEAALREREEAVKFAQAVAEENRRLKEEKDKSYAALLEQAKARTHAELEQAKRLYRDAYESGDADKVVAAQEALTSAKIRADRVANYKPPLQAEATPVKQEPTPAPAPQPVADPKASAWQAQNKWFGSDEEMTSLALGLHQKLVREGIDPRSDEYYDRINRRMRQVFPDAFDDAEADEEPTPAEKPRKPSVVAPATRSTAPTKIRLTASQVSLAKRLGITPEQYARQVAEDMRKQNV